MKDPLARLLFGSSVPEIGLEWTDMKDYNRRVQAYFEMKRWWDSLDDSKAITPLRAYTLINRV